jgi:phosphohistidine phosphatase SixA
MSLISRRVVLGFIGSIGMSMPALSDDVAVLVALLKQPGHVAFMRHAWAPFEGAPKSGPQSAEHVGPCATQRNLDDFGRRDAARIGDVLRRHGVTFDHVWTSHLCRCRETAELITQRPIDNLPLLNSYFSDPDKARGPAQLKYLKQFLNTTLPATARVLMVTHGSLITDLAGIDTGETEIVVVKADGRGEIVIVGRGIL